MLALNIINVITDDVYFLQGARHLLSEAPGNHVIYNDINTSGLRGVVKSVATNRQKIILYIHCFRKRRVVLRLVAAYNLQVFVVTHCKVSGFNNVRDPVIIPSFLSRKEFLQKIKSGKRHVYRKSSLRSKKIFKGLSAGVSVKDLAETLNITQKAVYAIKNQTIKKFGINSTKMNGFLLCRDLLEMNEIGLRYQRIADANFSSMGARRS